jgi:hypothetical protein
MFDRFSKKDPLEYKPSATLLPRGDGNDCTSQADDDPFHRFGLDFGSFAREQPSEIGTYDVLCGRHKAAFNNVGNRRFRITVALALDRYLSAKTRRDKSNVIRSIRSLVHSNGGRFLQMDHGQWIELNEERAHKKVAHAMRDAFAKTLQPIKLHKQDHGTSTLEKNQKQDISSAISVHFGCHLKKSNEFVTIDCDEDSVSFKARLDDDHVSFDFSPDGGLASIDDQSLALLLKNTA